MEQFQKFVTDNKITIEQTPIAKRTGSNSDWNASAIHFQITLLIDGRKLWAGEYSVGFGHAEQWIRGKEGRRYQLHGLGDGFGGTFKEYFCNTNAKYRDDSRPAMALKKLFAKHHKLDAADILLSLQMDISGSDQDFEDWAPELGYDADSIKAKAIWEDCNAIRRALKNSMTSEQFAQFQELEE